MGYPALAIQQPESPIKALGQAQGVVSGAQQIQMGQIQLQQARLDQQSRSTLMSLYAKNGGDMNQTLADAKASGQVTPEHLFQFQANATAQQVAAAKLDNDRLTNLDKIHDIAANELEGFKALPLNQRTPQALMAIGKRLENSGVNMQQIMPVINGLAQNPSDEAISNLETAFKGERWVVDNEIKQRQLASTPTAEQAQAKTAAELQTAQATAKKAQLDLLTMPTPEEAHTERAANILKMAAETAQANADTAMKRAQTSLLGAKPVFAFDPANNNQRVLTTMAEVKAKGFTNPVEASEGDISKEREIAGQFNDAQLNFSRYRNAMNALPGPLSNDSVSNITGILSDKEVGGLLDKLPGGAITMDQIKQAVTAKAWNKLSPAEQDATIGFLRSRASVIALMRAISPGARIQGEQYKQELLNIPSPIEGATVANKKLDSLEQNIDVGSKKLTRMPDMPSPQEVRAQIGSQATGPAVRPGGQFRGTPSQDTGQRQYQVGMIAEGLPGGPKTVTKVYPDGSFDAR